MTAMRIAILKTGHEIADTVAQSLAEGFNADIQETSRATDTVVRAYQAHIAYGILRGASEVFRAADKYGIPWFNCDRGYWKPNHYDGYYRISHKGTQAKYDPAFPITKEFDGEFAPIRNGGEYILICMPTQHVIDFFNLNCPKKTGWINDTAITHEFTRGLPCKIRPKDSKVSLDEDLAGAKLVLTFNSSVGWQALQKGIPCISDSLHSVVGSYYNTKSIDECIEMFNTMPRKPLFDFMRSHQFTLAEIEKGNAWPLLSHYISSSAGTQEKLLHQMSQPTASANALKSRFQSNI